jgi:flagellar protein FliL
MSKVEEKAVAKSKDKPKGKGLKKIIIFSVGGLAMLGCGVGAGLYASKNLDGVEKHEDPHRPKLVERSKEPQEEVEGGEGGEAKAPPKVGTISVKSDTAPVDPKKFEVTYFQIDQSLTANLADGQGFVQIGLSLATYYDSKVIANIKRQVIPIRSAILMVLSEQDGTVLASTEGKQLLQKQLTQSINRVLREKEGFGGVDNVYFTTMVIQ